MNLDLLIQSINKHVTLTEAEQAFMAEICNQRKVKKGQFLVYHGSISRHTYFVNQGSLKTYFIDLHGHEHTIQLAIEGWWISDLQSFILQQPAQLNVEAIEDSEVLEITYENLQRLYAEVPKFERYMRIIMQNAFISFQHRMLQNLSMSAEERYLAFLQKYPKLDLRMPQKLIASYLGISPEFLSKIRKRLTTHQ